MLTGIIDSVRFRVNGQIKHSSASECGGNYYYNDNNIIITKTRRQSNKNNIRNHNDRRKNIIIIIIDGKIKKRVLTLTHSLHHVSGTHEKSSESSV